MREVSYEELRAMQEENSGLVLIDVREPFEHAQQNLGGVNIPMSELPQRLSEVPQEGEVVLYCRSGGRSGMAIQSLAQAGYTNLINLRGGLMMAK